MKPIAATLAALVGLAAAQGTGDLCHPEADSTGICETVTWCEQHMAGWVSGACPSAPEDVKCCIDPDCGPGNKGICTLNSYPCNGKRLTGDCPGPSSYICCSPG